MNITCLETFSHEFFNYQNVQTLYLYTQSRRVAERGENT